jgi:hypothetical protein
MIRVSLSGENKNHPRPENGFAKMKTHTPGWAKGVRSFFPLYTVRCRIARPKSQFIRTPLAFTGCRTPDPNYRVELVEKRVELPFASVNS